jgi:hypothetical protein
MNNSYSIPVLPALVLNHYAYHNQIENDWPSNYSYFMRNPSNCAYESAENPKQINKEGLFVLSSEVSSNLHKYIKTSGTFIVKTEIKISSHILIYLRKW